MVSAFAGAFDLPCRTSAQLEEPDRQIQRVGRRRTEPLTRSVEFEHQNLMIEVQASQGRQVGQCDSGFQRARHGHTQLDKVSVRG